MTRKHIRDSDQTQIDEFNNEHV